MKKAKKVGAVKTWLYIPSDTKKALDWAVAGNEREAWAGLAEERNTTVEVLKEAGKVRPVGAIAAVPALLGLLSASREMLDALHPSLGHCKLTDELLPHYDELRSAYQNAMEVI